MTLFYFDKKYSPLECPELLIGPPARSAMDVLSL